jgi:hypothetical protein
MTIASASRTASAVAPARAARAASGRIRGRDLLSSGVRISVELTPLVVPDRAVVVRAIRDLIATGADARAGRRLRAGRWSYDPLGLDEQAEEMVRPLPLGMRGDEGLPRLRDALPDDLPFAVFLGDDRAALCIDHRLGDGFLSVMLTAGALAGRGVPAVFAASRDRDPLPAALASAFLRQPGRALSLVRDRWTQTSPSPEPAAEPAERGALGLVTAAMDGATFRDLARWSRGRVAPTLAVMFAMRTALERVGVPVSDEGSLLVDLRRYLPSGRSTLANFVVGHPVSASGGLDAAGARLSRDLHTGRPLAALTAGLAARAWRHGPPTAVPSSTAITVSDMGFLRALEPLPWAGDDSIVRVSVDPSARNGITVLTAVLGGRLHVSVSFDRSFCDPDAVSRACALLCHDPKELLP